LLSCDFGPFSYKIAIMSLFKPQTLFELQQQVRRVVALNFNDPVYLTAEIVRINNSRGHWYIELAEKDSESQKTLAKTSAVIWKNIYSQWEEEHGDLLPQILKEGIQIAFTAEVQYHEIYGFKLHLKTIDLSYTLGRESQRRYAIIQKLKKEGKMTVNAQISLPRSLQRIAVISSPTASGYSDFLETLADHPYQFQYTTQLFPAAMQGVKIETEVVHQLKAISQSTDSFDLIAIIRGGGGSMDLRDFDNYEISDHIAQSNLPVWTGIGHSTDQTIIDMVAHHFFKTPTGVADAINQHNLDLFSNLEEQNGSLQRLVQQYVENKKLDLHLFTQQLSYQFNSQIDKKRNRLVRNHESLSFEAIKNVQKNTDHLNHQKQRLADLAPRRILQRGYAAVEQSGRRIRRADQLNVSQLFSLSFADDQIKISPKNDNYNE